MKERRSPRRFQLKLKCFIRAQLSDEIGRCEWVTHNISSGGAYFVTPRAYPVGTRLEMEIMIPRNARASAHGSASCIRVDGEVLRADPTGMAVEFDDQYRIFRIPQETGRSPDPMLRMQLHTMERCSAIPDEDETKEEKIFEVGDGRNSPIPPEPEK